MKDIGISGAEFEVMKVVWKKSPVTSDEIIDGLAAGNEWSPKTVRTLIARLVKKQALKFKPEGRAYLYEPLVSREECVEMEGETFLHRMFDGALMPMLAHFVQSRKLTAKERKQLQELLTEE